LASELNDYVLVTKKMNILIGLPKHSSLKLGTP